MKERKLFEGTEAEQLFICTIITDKFSDEILGVKGLYSPTVDIVVDTTKAFYKEIALNMSFEDITVSEYVEKITEFAQEYISKNYEIKLSI